MTGKHVAGRTTVDPQVTTHMATPATPPDATLDATLEVPPPDLVPIEVCGLTKRFGSFTAIDQLDLQVTTGTVHGFLGPNGAGKSTTLRVLLGLYKPSAGTVRVLGHDPSRHPAQATAGVSAIPGDVALWPSLTGRQALDALAGLRGRDRYDAHREAELIERFALDPSKKVRTYSTGNRQKVMLVAAFAARTPLLVLDEPTSGLDPLMEREFEYCVRQATEEGRTVLLSSHLLAEVERLCTEVTIIKDGRLVESGSLAQMRHLAASEITATLERQRAGELADRLAADGLRPEDGDHPDGGRPDRIRSDGTWPSSGPGSPVEPETVHVAGSVERDRVPEVLGALLGAGAQDITCTPASLEALFLRHYEVAAR